MTAWIGGMGPVGHPLTFHFPAPSDAQRYFRRAWSWSEKSISVSFKFEVMQVFGQNFQHFSSTLAPKKTQLFPGCPPPQKDMTPGPNGSIKSNILIWFQDTNDFKHFLFMISNISIIV